MLRTAAPRACASFFLAVLLGMVTLVPRAALGKDCGGGVPCECGDRIVESTTLSADLNGCRQQGLTLAAPLLDCAGHQISGPGDRTLWDGVEIDAISDAEVRNCRIRNFRRGIYSDGGANNRIGENVLFGNQIGIQLGAGASTHRIESNQVHDNRDEGIHLGAGSAANVVVENEVWANARENFSLIETRGNRLIRNVIGDAREAGIFIKHSDDNFFAENAILDRAVLIRGDSSGNVFEDNDVLAGGFTFEAIEDDLGVTFPHHNQVVRGKVRKASTCFRFYGAQDNTIQDVSVDRCRVVDLKVGEDIEAIGNSIDVVADPPTDPDDQSPTCSGCSRGAQDVAAVQLNDRRDDLFKLRWSFETTLPIDPATAEVEVVLSTPEGTLTRGLAPAGALAAKKKELRVNKRGLDPDDGLRRFTLTSLGENRWLIRAALEGDLAGADRPDLIVRWQIGDEAFVLTDTWSPSVRGWRLLRPRPTP